VLGLLCSSQRCQLAPTDGDYQDLNLFSSGAPCLAGKPSNPPNFTLKLAKARIGGGNGHRNDSQEIKILKEGGWREKMSNRNSLLASSSREARRRARDTEMRTHFFSPLVAIRKLTGKERPALVQQLEMGVSHWTNAYWLRNTLRSCISRQAPAVTSLQKSPISQVPVGARDRAACEDTNSSLW